MSPRRLARRSSRLSASGRSPAKARKFRRKTDRAEPFDNVTSKTPLHRLQERSCNRCNSFLTVTYGASSVGYDSLFCMANVQTRRNFLRTAPIAAAALSATLPLTDTLLHAQAPAAEAGDGATFKVFPAATLEG